MTPIGEHPCAPVPVTETLEAVLALWLTSTEGVEVIESDETPAVSDEL